MTHTALARTYRPTRFADLVAQEHVAAGLAGAVSKNRVAHGYLLTDPRGVGKTSAARILAMALNCERPDSSPAPGEPCGECDSCRRIWSGAANLDVVEIDAASHRGVDDARELRERASYAASGPDRHKVYIVDEAHMLTREAWNALLKILEEPPPQVVFVFATTEPQKIASNTTAVLSRLQRFDFRSIGPKAIETRLAEVAARENIEIEQDALVLISRVANGGMRDGLSLLDQVLVFGDGAVTAGRVREALGLIDDELYAEVLRIIAERRAAEVFPFISKIVEQGADIGEFLNGLVEALRGVMLATLGTAPTGITEVLRDAIAEVAPTMSKGDVLRMLDLFGEAEMNIRRSPNARLHVETLLLHWTLLDRTVELEAVLAALGSRSAGGGGGGTEIPPRPEMRPPAELEPPTPRVETPPAPAASADRDPLELVRSEWARVVTGVAKKSRILEGAIRDTRVVGADGSRLLLEVSGGESHLEGLSRKVALLQEVISSVAGRPLEVDLRPATAAPPPDGEAASEKRQTPEEDRAARMRAYKAQDPALNDMAEALDLELTE